MATLNLGRIKPVFKGAYNNATAYVVDDIVTSGGSSYICIAASTGNAVSNATYWTQMAAGGTDLNATLTTQGDILYRDGSGLQRLAIGTANQELRVNSSANALEYHTPSAGGILQVKSSTKVDTQSFTYGSSAVRMDITGLSVSLTPSSSSNKVLVWFNVSHWGNDSHCQIERLISGGSYSIISPPTGYGSKTPTHSGGSHRNTYELNTANMTILDNPSTTSALTYKVTFNNAPAGGNTGYVNRTESDANDGNGERAISTITAMEVASGAL